MDYRTINDQLKEARLSKGISIHKLSELSGVSASHISRIEQKKRNPSPKTLKKLIKPLQIEEQLIESTLCRYGDNEKCLIDLKTLLLDYPVVFDGHWLSHEDRQFVIKQLEMRTNNKTSLP